jgi:hypothetical protein
MSVVRLLSDHKGWNPPPLAVSEYRHAHVVQAAEAVEGDPSVAGSRCLPHIQRDENIPVADAVCKGTGCA